MSQEGEVLGRVWIPGHWRVTKEGKRYWFSGHWRTVRRGRIITVIPGNLSKYGYDPDLPESERRAALDKAVKQEGALEIFRRLHAQVIFRKNKKGRYYEIFKSDRDYIKRKYYGTPLWFAKPGFP